MLLLISNRNSCMFILSSSDSWQLRIYYIPWPAKKNAAQNFYTNLPAKNSQNLCSPHSQLAKTAKKQNFKKTYGKKISPNS